MKVAVLQMNSGPDRQANLDQAADLLARAAQAGAGMAVLPEHFSHMQSEGILPARPEPLRGPLLEWLSQRAAEHGLWLVGGSFNQRVAGHRRIYNTCPVVDPQSNLAAHYQKAHLFDLDMPGHQTLLESNFVLPGRRLVALDTPAGRLGLSICYDLRFPELYRRLRLKGAEVLACPSAFTKVTGQAHWEILVRARAVENACFVLAAAQWGAHGRGRESFGQAMIVNPWGEIVAQCPDGVGLAVAEVDPQRVADSRARLDSTAHARFLPAAWRR